jgi:hypothetical protein
MYDLSAQCRDKTRATRGYTRRRLLGIFLILLVVILVSVRPPAWRLSPARTGPLRGDRPRSVGQGAELGRDAESVDGSALVAAAC